MEQLFFGIDGGGTQSRLGICDENGHIRGVVKGGSTNMYAAGFDTACANIRALLKKVKEECRIDIRDCAAGCFASAGVSTESEKDNFRRFFEAEGLRCPLHICNDALAALAGGTGKPEGIIIISGTGSIAAGLDGCGRTVRAGGLGHLISDEGSGFCIGLEGMKAAAAAAERRGMPTVLEMMLFEHYQIESIRELFPFLYTQFDKPRIASFAPAVFTAARRKDRVALAIVENAAKDLSLLAYSVYSRLFEGKKTEAVLSGGVFEHDPAFARKTAAYISEALPPVQVIPRRFDAVTGACILARTQAAEI
ncbi:MAG: BadF/BadG/BcrA/BcrD ATPase family protein [Treponema sp.]